ncbi:LysR substrate-binding domain-containing protein [Kiloniella sp.]|uniref:LysR substrate-binding domain-containing protein n=1 Tax=Kiloniella sp. TaxID=1938587 RepID=UPI003B011795
MNFRQIEAFRAVMVTGSGTEAAKMLFITQPAISRLISDLEYGSGLQLFIRKPNRLEPTPEALALYREVDRAFIGLEEIRTTAEAIVNQQQGSLRIVAMPVCVESFLPSLISEFTKRHPKVSIELETAPRIQALEMVRSQRFDIGVVSMMGQDSVNLKVEPFCQQKAVCVLPRDHPLRDKSEIQAKDLEFDPFISLSAGSPFRALIDTVFFEENVKRKLAIETRTQRTIYELVRRGAGVSILDPFVTDAQDTDIITKPFVPEVTWDYATIQLHSAPPSLNTQSFEALLMAHFSVEKANFSQ